MLDTLDKDDPESSDCYRNMVDTLREPCLELDEVERQFGVTDILVAK